MSRPGSDNLGFCVLAVVGAIAIACSPAVADVEPGIDDVASTQFQLFELFEMLPVAQQAERHAPACNIPCQIDVDRTSRRGVNFTDILSAAGLGRPTTTNCCPPPETHIPPSQKVRQLPGSPGAATLFLMGVGCLGAVKLGRSARGLHLQSLPDWYHTGGPIQIGGAAVLDFDYDTPVFSVLDEPSGVRQFRHYPRRDIPSRHENQFFLSVEAPRGPPRFSF